MTERFWLPESRGRLESWCQLTGAGGSSCGWTTHRAGQSAQLLAAGRNSSPPGPLSGQPENPRGDGCVSPEREEGRRWGRGGGERQKLYFLWPRLRSPIASSLPLYLLPTFES